MSLKLLGRRRQLPRSYNSLQYWKSSSRNTNPLMKRFQLKKKPPLICLQGWNNFRDCLSLFRDSVVGSKSLHWKKSIDIHIENIDCQTSIYDIYTSEWTISIFLTSQDKKKRKITKKGYCNDAGHYIYSRANKILNTLFLYCIELWS